MHKNSERSFRCSYQGKILSRDLLEQSLRSNLTIISLNSPHRKWDIIRSNLSYEIHPRDPSELVESRIKRKIILLENLWKFSSRAYYIVLQKIFESRLQIKNAFLENLWKFSTSDPSNSMRSLKYIWELRVN